MRVVQTPGWKKYNDNPRHKLYKEGDLSLFKVGCVSNLHSIDLIMAFDKNLLPKSPASPVSSALATAPSSPGRPLRCIVASATRFLSHPTSNPGGRLSFSSPRRPWRPNLPAPRNPPSSAGSSFANPPRAPARYRSSRGSQRPSPFDRTSRHHPALSETVDTPHTFTISRRGAPFHTRAPFLLSWGPLKFDDRLQSPPCPHPSARPSSPPSSSPSP